jgi:hypothetical protein
MDLKSTLGDKASEDLPESSTTDAESLNQYPFRGELIARRQLPSGNP